MLDMQQVLPKSDYERLLNETMLFWGDLALVVDQQYSSQHYALLQRLAAGKMSWLKDHIKSLKDDNQLLPEDISYLMAIFRTIKKRYAGKLTACRFVDACNSRYLVV